MVWEIIFLLNHFGYKILLDSLSCPCICFFFWSVFLNAHQSQEDNSNGFVYDCSYLNVLQSEEKSSNGLVHGCNYLDDKER